MPREIRKEIIVSDNYEYLIESYSAKVKSWIRGNKIRCDKYLFRLFCIAMELSWIRMSEVDESLVGWLMLAI